MLRCSETSVEPVIVVVEPISPHSRPKIALRVGEKESYFEGNPLPTGAGIRIPADGIELATGPWKGAHELAVKISDGGSDIGGIVELEGLSSAIQVLADCTAHSSP
jgi:hypothetical protein